MESKRREEHLNWYIVNRPIYKQLAIKVENILGDLLNENIGSIHAITSRAKDLDSFSKKIDRKTYKSPSMQMHDLAGIRIITYVEDDIEPICQIIKKAFQVDPKNSVDKKKLLGTDKVGYQSIHFVASFKDDRLKLPEYKKFKGRNFEIQIRTILQHAWAEIEHDRNYKFAGELPIDVKRRFSLLAGSLELVDREFNAIAKQIDIISKSVKASAKVGELDIPVNTTTVKSYLEQKLEQLIELGHYNNFYNGESPQVVIKELKLFGIVTLDQLDKLITSKFLKIYTEYEEIETSTYSSFLINLMIFTDYEKYFTRSWRKDWNKFEAGDKRVLAKLGVPLESIKSKYGVE